MVKGKIDVILKRDADAIGFVVVDNGPGIPDSELARVLDRFYRVAYRGAASRDAYCSQQCRRTGPLGVGNGFAAALTTFVSRHDRPVRGDRGRAQAGP